MPLIQIAAYRNDHYPTAAVNPALVAAVYTERTTRAGTVIELMARDPEPSVHYPDGKVRKIVSPTPLADILAALAPFVSAPFVPVELVASTSIADLHVNPAAVVAVLPQRDPQGHGYLWLNNGEQRYVAAAALTALGALLAAPPAAAAARVI